MEIGQRLRDLREAKNLSQGDIEKRTGLVRCYLSRVENGHTVPSVETLEKIARAYDMPTYQLFVGLEEKSGPSLEATLSKSEGNLFGRKLRERRYLMRLARLLGEMNPSDRDLLLSLTEEMARRLTR